MVDIQSRTAENRRKKRKRKEEEQRRRKKIETAGVKYDGRPITIWAP